MLGSESTTASLRNSSLEEKMRSSPRIEDKLDRDMKAVKKVAHLMPHAGIPAPKHRLYVLRIVGAILFLGACLACTKKNARR